ncbi:hypothetical protein PVAP13_7NG060517 [Panicum virgatum]|uniref:Uncharacterized protein n=1 Tax=Panicum virgatum TaxID=38727 RepID=A0A8T0PW45_PANVG|nr:hypothetical protein PVAP13_7NG060517 [Panicum virgatum]
MTGLERGSGVQVPTVRCDSHVFILIHGAARLSDAASVAYAQVSHQVWAIKEPICCWDLRTWHQSPSC